MKAKSKMFHAGPFTKWEKVLKAANQFMTDLGRERLINVSHASDQSVGHIIVWYWSDGMDDDDEMIVKV